MCLVLAFTNTKKIKLSACLNEIGNTLLKAEDDGFGYAIQGKAGVFGEKTIAKKFRTRLTRLNHVNLPIVKNKYSAFGQPSELVGPGVFHGRTSTNYISLPDTHPMQIAGWNLIHNGVVDDHGPAYEKLTQNDSEDVLRRLLDSVGTANPMDAIETYLEGYYAFAAIDPDGRLHIARDGIASLHIAFSAKYETFIIGTTEELILKINKILDAKIGPIDEIDSEVYCIFVGNELTYCQDFKSRGYSSRQSAHAAASLGHAIGPFGSSTNPPVVSGGGEIIDMSEAAWSKVDDDKWQENIMDFLRESDKHPDRGGGLEWDYAKYQEEIKNMDASYQIYDVDDRPFTLQEFRKLDHVRQEQCTILRADGTVVDPEHYETPKLARGRHASE